uniref:Retrotransposon protein, putative, unclassified n=1 Tax=Tanacetum cinerariifolium TaxID=118510 RepID=A0A6L2N8S9_TANCI|nr:retrotransposon protein, putative, unclassified [Tanacetum cinerariifolium]
MILNISVIILKKFQPTSLPYIQLLLCKDILETLMIDKDVTKWIQASRSLSHLNFNTINDLARNDLVAGLPKFKYHKEHLCPSCEQGKSKRASHPLKPVPNSRQRLHLLHMDLCGPMRIASINEKRYILLIVDDYSRYTWVHFLRKKDEAPEVIIKFLKRITVLLQSPIIIIRTDNGTEFKNQVLKVYFESVGISHQMSFVRTPQQNGVVERRNRTLVEAARTMLIFSRAPLFLWAEAIATAVYVNQPDGFVDPYHPEKVYRLKKALYGLKQAPRAWYDELSNFLVSKGFSKGSIDPTLFITKHGGDILLVQVYVDDIIFGSTNPKLSKQFEKLMHNKFEMSMMGELKFFLGILIHKSPRGIFINQAKYAQEILIKHGMTSCDSIGTPMATKHLDVDLSGTPVDQTKYRNSDHAGCLDSRKSTSGGIQFLGGDKLVSWSSKKQDDTSMSSAEAEYVSLSACCAQVLWLRTKLTDYGFHFDKIPMYYDSKATIAISCNPVQHFRTKHIDVRYHFIKEKVEKGIVELFFVRTEYQLADLFTKALSEDRFKYLVRRVGMRCLTPEELEVLANESA